MKKITVVLLIGMMTFGLMACGEKEPATFESQQIGESVENGADETEIPLDPPKGQESTMPSEENKETSSGESSAQSETGEGQAEEGFADNFAVDNETAAAFAQQIKEAVAAKDIEALADLTSFPVYVGFKDGGMGVETREDFVALGADKIFTAELVEAAANSAKTEFPPSMAGFTLSDGLPGITFAVVNGELKIVGINY